MMSVSRNPAKLYLVIGYVVSGKSTVSNQLQSVTNAEIIRTDKMRKQMYDLEFDYSDVDLGEISSADEIWQWIEQNDSGRIDFQQVANPLLALEESEYAEIVDMCMREMLAQSENVYNACFRNIFELLSESKDAIFDATFSDSEHRTRAYDIAGNAGIENVYIIQVMCGEDAARSRLESRAEGLSDAEKSNAVQMEIYRIIKNDFDKSHIDLDDPESVTVKRIVYHTDSHDIELFGEPDSVTEMIESDVIDVLTERFG